MTTHAVPFDSYTYSILLSSISNDIVQEDSHIFRSYFYQEREYQRINTPYGESVSSTAVTTRPATYEHLTEVVVSHMLDNNIMLTDYCWRVASAPYGKDLNWAGLERLSSRICSFDPWENDTRAHKKAGTQSARTITNSRAWQALRLNILRDSIGCLGKLGRADAAYELLKDFNSDSKRGRQHGSRTSKNADTAKDDIQNCWLRVIRAYAEGQNDWRRALEVLNDMRTQGYQITPLLWRYIFKSCAANEDMETLVSVLRLSYSNDGFLPDEESWGLLIGALDKSAFKSKDHSAEVDGSSSTSYLSQEKNILKDFIGACPRQVQKYIVASIVRYIDTKDNVTHHDIHAFLSDYKNLFDLRNTTPKNFVKVVKQVGQYPSPSLPVWNLNDIACLKSKQVAQHLGPPILINCEATQPTTTKFLTRMKRCALESDVKGCFEVYEDLKEHNSIERSNNCEEEIITSDFFDILLSMCVKHKHRTEEVDKVYSLMLKMKIEPSKTAYWQMLRVYAATGNTSGAISVAERCRKDSLFSPSIEAIHIMVLRILCRQSGRENSEEAISFINSLFESGIKTKRLYATLITEQLKMSDVRGALDTVAQFLNDDDKDLHVEDRYMDMAHMSVLNSVITSNSISYYEKGRITDQYITSLMKKRIKTLPAFSLYTDYLIKDRNDIYVYVDMLNEMSVIFGQNVCTIWEVTEFKL
jgi:hypothetical protein